MKLTFRDLEELAKCVSTQLARKDEQAIYACPADARTGGYLLRDGRIGPILHRGELRVCYAYLLGMHEALEHHQRAAILSEQLKQP